MAKKLLIIGGSGFVSGTLARIAINKGYDVWAITRGQKPLPEGVKGIIADRKNDIDFKKAIASADCDWDITVDCIGYTVEDAKQDIEVLKNRTGVFVFISTDFVFDPAKRKFPQPEESDYYASGGYGGNKRLCELELMKSDLNWVVFRPCHIYGPGSELGCLPLNARDPELVNKIRNGVELELVGGGYFLQQPIFAEDLARLILSVDGNAKCNNKIFQSAGPDIIESRTYYKIIAEYLKAEFRVKEIPVDATLAQNPDMSFFLCHRIYDLRNLGENGLETPSTSIEEGLHKHTEWIINRHK